MKKFRLFGNLIWVCVFFGILLFSTISIFYFQNYCCNNEIATSNDNYKIFNELSDDNVFKIKSYIKFDLFDELCKDKLFKIESHPNVNGTYSVSYFFKNGFVVEKINVKKELVNFYMDVK